ncbi:type VI secretion system Vgr family protein [Paraburkholderia sp. J7]|uniref:type VI secretion system Vgr family protein n=1 Tax=Paraburkholderia sp. J7 TaxID=2805438 RepID=UPI002AB6242A|nr:type VI secretion system tip protein TssI/VgrG [Paraburkholderia sp. J7]
MRNDFSGSYRKPEHTLMISGPNLPTWGLERYDALGRREQVERPLVVPISVEGEDGVGMLFRYVVLCRTSVESLELGSRMPTFDHNKLVGQDVTLHIDIPGKGEFIPGMPGDTGRGNRGHYVREINGRVSQAEFVREDERSRVYRLIIEPPFAQARLGQDYRFFKECTVEDVLTEIMGRYTRYELRLHGPLILGHYPRRDLIRQHFESDFAFFHRLCEYYGIFYWFEHRDGDCVMVLADNLGAFHPHGEAYETLLYSTDNRIDEEHIDCLDVASRVTEGKVTGVDHDPQRPRLGNNVVPMREEEENPRDTGDAHQEFYGHTGASQPLQGAMGLSATPNDIEAEVREAALVRMQALRCVGLRARGHGNMRGLLPGFTFDLTGYPLEEVNAEYLVLRTKLTLVEVGQVSGAGQVFRCETEFEIQPANEYYRMPLDTPLPVVVAERAIVTGPDGNIIWTDAQGRIRCQPVPDREGTFDENSFIWVTPLQPWQNGQVGTLVVPRIGSEVILGYINGNPDMPVMLGSIVNAHNLPGWELPHNQWLSGMRSRMDGGLSSNHLALDDTKNQQQAQLASDHGKSSLSLGYNTRIDGNKGRQDARGEGWELRTDLWGALRAALGLYLSTHGRKNAAGKAKDMGETLSRLTEARGIHEELAQTAQRHGAQEATDNQGDVEKAIKDANAGLRGKGDGEFPEFDNPDIAISSAANVHTTAEGSTHIVSREHTALTAGGNVAIAALKSLYASVQGSIALYAHKAIRLITPGPVRIQSQGDNVDLIARRVLNLLAEQDEIRLTAKRIVMNGGGTQLTLGADGILGHTNGAFLVHAGSHATDDPQDVPIMAPITDISEAKVVDHFVLPDNGSGLTLAQQRYRIKLHDGQLIEGTSNEHGETSLVMSQSMQIAEIRLLRKDGSVMAIYQPMLTRTTDTAFKSQGSSDV